MICPFGMKNKCAKFGRNPPSSVKTYKEHHAQTNTTLANNDLHL